MIWSLKNQEKQAKPLLSPNNNSSSISLTSTSSTSSASAASSVELRVQQCTKCSTNFTRKESFRRHKIRNPNCGMKKKKIRKRPTSQEMPCVAVAECNECGMRFGKKASLRIHKNEHTDRFRCSSCAFGFTSIRSLARHNNHKENCKNISMIRESMKRKSRLIFTSPIPALKDQIPKNLETNYQEIAFQSKKRNHSWIKHWSLCFSNVVLQYIFEWKKRFLNKLAIISGVTRVFSPWVTLTGTLTRVCLTVSL